MSKDHTESLKELRTAMGKLEGHRERIRQGRRRAVGRAQAQADTAEEAIGPLTDALAEGRGGHLTYRRLVREIDDRHRVSGICDDYDDGPE